MQKHPKASGPAVFMYSAIACTALSAALCLTLYYTSVFPSAFLLWTGICSFMIFYHFGLRILFGEITLRLSFDYNHPFFKGFAFEKKILRALRVRQWKDRVLTFNPEHYDVRARTLHELASTMAKSETDHWFNELISLSSLLFSLIWGQFPIFLVTAILAMLFDFQFILVQRYNRPIVLRLIQKHGKDALLFSKTKS